MALLIFYVLLLSLFTHITSALITYDKGTLLDIEHRYNILFQDILSSNSSWTLEILRKSELNNGHSNNLFLSLLRIPVHFPAVFLDPSPREVKRAGIRNRLRKRAHSPPLPSILLANVQSSENNIRARISFQRDIKDCNILCLSERWLTTSVPDTAVMPSDNFSVLWMTEQPRPVKRKVEECVS